MKDPLRYMIDEGFLSLIYIPTDAGRLFYVLYSDEFDPARCTRCTHDGITLDGVDYDNTAEVCEEYGIKMSTLAEFEQFRFDWSKNYITFTNIFNNIPKHFVYET